MVSIAEGDLDTVPAATLDHVRACDDCRRELAASSLFGRRVREALVVGLDWQAPVRSRRMRLLG
ncbi:MAG TPA: hypothetical protein VIA06_09910 [Candidatus Dormibacteraeota bacterium]|jgi:hypothetical protein|nr:hypothetical protein [Candidatus Dormibacteraeota bacterium]